MHGSRAGFDLNEKDKSNQPYVIHELILKIQQYATEHYDICSPSPPGTIWALGSLFEFNSFESLSLKSLSYFKSFCYLDLQRKIGC